MTTGRTAVLAASFVAVSVVFVAGVANYRELGPVQVSIDTAGIAVDSGAARIIISGDELLSARLEDELPSLRGGFGWHSSATLRGRYRLDGHPGHVNVSRQRPPFLLLRTRDSFVLINWPDSAATRRLHDAIVQRWPAAAGP
jgi:hypothetical protein